MGEGPLVDGVSAISTSYLTAVSQLEQIENMSDSYATADHGSAANSSEAHAEMIGFIERGDCQNALLTLEKCIAEIEDKPSEIIQRYSLFGINSAVYQLCQHVGFHLSEEQLGFLLAMNDVHATHYALLKLIPAVCAHINARNRKAVLPSGKLVMNYLEQHFKDYEISAHVISEAVGIGINRVNAIVKEQTGMSCKSYLTQLRVRHARELLTNSSLSVAEIAQEAGYSSASYFIRVFRETVGETPDSYRRSHETNLTAAGAGE